MKILIEGKIHQVLCYFSDFLSSLATVDKLSLFKKDLEQVCFPPKKKQFGAFPEKHEEIPATGAHSPFLRRLLTIHGI